MFSRIRLAFPASRKEPGFGLSIHKRRSWAPVFFNLFANMAFSATSLHLFFGLHVFWTINQKSFEAFISSVFSISRKDCNRCALTNSSIFSSLVISQMFHYLCDHLLFPKSYVQLSFECSLKLFISFSFLAQQPTPKEKSEGFLHATFTHVFSQIQQHNSFTYESRDTLRLFWIDIFTVSWSDYYDWTRVFNADPHLLLLDISLWDLENVS